MGPRRRAASIQVAREELAKAGLPDVRQRLRLERVVKAMAARPEKGLPQLFKDASQLEAAYRFFSNERVSWKTLLAAHAAQTQERAKAVERPVIAHDTSEFSFGGERLELGRLSGKARGFLGHFALAANAKTGMPLGVVHCEPLVREGEPKRRESAKAGDETNEALRWERGVAAAHALLPGAVHVMDREADSYLLLESMLARHQDFVVRLSHRERRAEGGPIGELVATASSLVEREVELSPRKPQSGSKQKKRYPARRMRTARLQISAYRADLLRAHPLGAEVSARIVVNVVRALEVNPPEGEEPVDWMLYTSLPVETAEQVLEVVDLYRRRWMIEEFFKALKTGCAFEKRQLESVNALLNMLAVSVPIAWHLLRLRTLARIEPNAPGAALLTAAQLRCLRLELGTAARTLLPKDPTARQVLLAIARLGGHLKNNGDPGWITLGRGLQDLLMLERGYLLARSDQS
jgi:Transposase DNA-binding/Transposase DDE domain